MKVENRLTLATVVAPLSLCELKKGPWKVSLQTQEDKPELNLTQAHGSI